jgi:hypothetical protein
VHTHAHHARTHARTHTHALSLFLTLSLSLSLSLARSLSLSLFLCVSLCLSLSPSLCLCFCLSVYLSLSLNVLCACDSGTRLLCECTTTVRDVIRTLLMGEMKTPFVAASAASAASLRHSSHLSSMMLRTSKSFPRRIQVALGYCSLHEYTHESVRNDERRPSGARVGGTPPIGRRHSHAFARTCTHASAHAHTQANTVARTRSTHTRHHKVSRRNERTRRRC